VNAKRSRKRSRTGPAGWSTTVPCGCMRGRGPGGTRPPRTTWPSRRRGRPEVDSRITCEMDRALYPGSPNRLRSDPHQGAGAATPPASATRTAPSADGGVPRRSSTSSLAASSRCPRPSRAGASAACGTQTRDLVRAPRAAASMTPAVSRRRPGSSCPVSVPERGGAAMSAPAGWPGRRPGPVRHPANGRSHTGCSRPTTPMPRQHYRGPGSCAGAHRSGRRGAEQLRTGLPCPTVSARPGTAAHRGRPGWAANISRNWISVIGTPPLYRSAPLTSTCLTR
jgi:hypothetical protein